MWCECFLGSDSERFHGADWIENATRRAALLTAFCTIRETVARKRIPRGRNEIALHGPDSVTGRATLEIGERAVTHAE